MDLYSSADTLAAYGLSHHMEHHFDSLRRPINIEFDPVFRRESVSALEQQPATRDIHQAADSCPDYPSSQDEPVFYPSVNRIAAVGTAFRRKHRTRRDNRFH